MDHHIKKQLVLKTRHRRVRRKVAGSAEQPRLSVSRSLKNVEAQLIDDVAGRSLLGMSSLSKEVREQAAGAGGKCAQGRVVGRLLAEKALQSGIQKVVFDRGGFRYHGRVKALAEGAREGGLKF
ncbi:50S ribosomal protein L18 [bacterium]|nr:50S ribosomal protein L18 [bacterium]